MLPDLGKWLFPRLQPYQRKYQMRVLCASLLVGLIVAGIIVLLMILVQKSGRFELALP